jgi:hypothetical protein
MSMCCMPLKSPLPLDPSVLLLYQCFPRTVVLLLYSIHHIVVFVTAVRAVVLQYQARFVVLAVHAFLYDSDLNLARALSSVLHLLQTNSGSPGLSSIDSPVHSPGNLRTHPNLRFWNRTRHRALHSLFLLLRSEHFLYIYSVTAYNVFFSNYPSYFSGILSSTA